jgi:hypothetical protein
VADLLTLIQSKSNTYFPPIVIDGLILPSSSALKFNVIAQTLDTRFSIPVLLRLFVCDFSLSIPNYFKHARKCEWTRILAFSAIEYCHSLKL